MKTNFKLIGIAIVSVLVLNLNAQDFEPFQVSGNQNQILAVVEKPARIVSARYSAPAKSATPVGNYSVLLNTERDVALQLENWMVDVHNFESHGLNFYETDEVMHLESWMTNETIFAPGKNVPAAVEPALKLKSWMTDATHFTSTVIMKTEMDKPLELENWMVESENFNRFSSRIAEETDAQLELGSWMLNSENFQ